MKVALYWNILYIIINILLISYIEIISDYRDLESDRIGTNELSKEKDVESKSLSNTKYSWLLTHFLMYEK